MGTGIFHVPNAEARDAWVASELRALPAQARILDAGCGTQRYRQFCQHLSYHAQDFAAYDGAGDGRGMQAGGWDYGKLDYVSDIWNIPAPDASFDAILCTEVLEHVLYPTETLREFARLLKSRGILILTVPFASTVHMSPHFYYSGFDDNYFSRILPECGFQKPEISHNGDKAALALQLMMSLERGYSSKMMRALFRVMAVPLALMLRFSKKLMLNSILNEGALGLHVRAIRA